MPSFDIVTIFRPCVSSVIRPSCRLVSLCIPEIDPATIRRLPLCRCHCTTAAPSDHCLYSTRWLLVGHHSSRWYVATAVRSSSRLHHRSDCSAHCGRCLAVLCPAHLATSVPVTVSHYDHSLVALRPLLCRCRWSSHRAFLVRLVPVGSGSRFGCCPTAPIFVHFLHTHIASSRTLAHPYRRVSFCDLR